MLKNFPGAIPLLQGGPVGLIVSRLSDGLIMEVNQAFLRLSGYQSQEVIGFTSNHLRMWHDSEARQKMALAVMATGHLFDAPVAFRCKAGNKIDLRCSTLVIDIADEVCLLSILRAPRQNDAAFDLHLKEVSLLDSVEASCGLGFWDFDVPSGQVHWSYGMEAIYGLPKGSFKGSAEDFRSRIHPDDVAMNLAESQASIVEKRPFNIKFRIVRPDSCVRWVESRGAPRYDSSGAFRGASGLHLDVTEQVVRDEEMQVRALVMENMAEGVVMVEWATAKILFANRRLEEMLGYPPGALTGLPIHTINARSESNPVEVAQAIIAHMRLHGSWRGEVKNLCADGREIWCSCSVSEIVLKGQGSISIAVHTDITEQKQAQEASRIALAELQRMSLNYQDALEAERSALARDVHDQLGASLTGLRMEIEMLASQLKVQAPELVTTAAKLIANAQAAQMAAREISTRLRPALLDDMGLAAACRWYVNDWSAKTGIATTTRINSPKAQLDPNLATDMFRALQELLNNVARHAGATKVHVVLTCVHSELKLQVQDNGCGFDPEQKPEGFGLLGVRERVRHHDGALRIDRVPQGARLSASMRLKKTP